MLNPKYKRYAERIQELIEEGKAVVKLARTSSSFSVPYIQGEDKIILYAWVTKSTNILETVFGDQSPQFRSFQDVLPSGGIRHLHLDYEIHAIIGILIGALDDLEKGYLIGQEYFIAGEIFDSILEQAKNLLKIGYKDPAAVLGRVVIEDALRRIARNEGIDDTFKASKINDELRQNKFYPQAQWRFIQAWLDIGNNAAHGNFDQYDADMVQKMFEGEEQFILVYLLPQEHNSYV